jgi:hypothetical protein
MERAFRMDYARRYAGQRRLAGAGLLLIWIAVIVRDWLLLNTFDPGILFHVGVCATRRRRGYGCAGMVDVGTTRL